LIGFSDSVKQERLKQLLVSYKRLLNRERFTVTVKALTEQDAEDVYDVRVPGVNAFDANGFYVHNCGEQPFRIEGAYNPDQPSSTTCFSGGENATYRILANVDHEVDSSTDYGKICGRSAHEPHARYREYACRLLRGDLEIHKGRPEPG
jgi:hypothetical protein